MEVSEVLECLEVLEDPGLPLRDWLYLELLVRVLLEVGGVPVTRDLGHEGGLQLPVVHILPVYAWKLRQ